MFCHNCGKEMPEGARFCSRCGTKLQSEEQAVPRKSADDIPFTINETPDSEPAQTPRQQKAGAAQSQNHWRQQNNDRQEPDLQKKPKKRFGCTAMIFTLLIAAVIFAGGLFVWTHLANTDNALLPENAEEADSIEQTQLQDEADFENESDLNISAEEAALRRRVQNIYREVLQFNRGANYEGRYCTTSLFQTLKRATQFGHDWIEVNWWTFTKEFHYPSVSFIKVANCSTSSAKVFVEIRPVRNSQIVSNVTLYMQNEEGSWLIDDFVCEGRSVKQMARRYIEEQEIRSEIMREMQDTL